MTFDIERARRDTPAVQNMIHFNNAGASLMPQVVVDAVVDYIQLEAQIGGYEATVRRKDAHERAYHAIAALLNCRADEIAIVENATRAWDMAFYSIPFQKGDKIITAQAEYSSNYIAFLQAQHKYGVEIVVIPNDEYGQIDVQALETAIDERVKLIAITHVPSTGGLVNPAEAVGKIARQHNILYLLDACQSVGQWVVDVQKIGCDFLSVTGRKFLRAPRGNGFLYVRRERIQQFEPILLDTHAATWVAKDRYIIREDARRFENWETNYSTKVGLAVAVDYALSFGLGVIQARVQSLASGLRSQLRAINGVTVQDLGREQCGIVTFTREGHDSYALRDAFAKQHINVSVSPIDYTRLDFEARHLPNLVRASVHYYNTDDEIARFCEVLSGL